MWVKEEEEEYLEKLAVYLSKLDICGSCRAGEAIAGLNHLGWRRWREEPKCEVKYYD